MGTCSPAKQVQYRSNSTAQVLIPDVLIPNVVRIVWPERHVCQKGGLTAEFSLLDLPACIPHFRFLSLNSCLDDN